MVELTRLETVMDIRKYALDGDEVLVAPHEWDNRVTLMLHRHDRYGRLTDFFAETVLCTPLLVLRYLYNEFEGRPQDVRF